MQWTKKEAKNVQNLAICLRLRAAEIKQPSDGITLANMKTLISGAHCSISMAQLFSRLEPLLSFPRLLPDSGSWVWNLSELFSSFFLQWRRTSSRVTRSFHWTSHPCPKRA